MTEIHLEVPEEIVEFLYDPDTGGIRFRPMITDDPTHGAHVAANVTRRFYGSGWDVVPDDLWGRAREHLRNAGILKEEL